MKTVIAGIFVFLLIFLPLAGGFYSAFILHNVLLAAGFCVVLGKVLWWFSTYGENGKNAS